MNCYIEYVKVREDLRGRKRPKRFTSIVFVPREKLLFILMIEKGFTNVWQCDTCSQAQTI